MEATPRFELGNRGFVDLCVKVNIKLLFFGGVKCRFWANQSSPYHQTGACL